MTLCHSCEDASRHQLSAIFNGSHVSALKKSVRVMYHSELQKVSGMTKSVKQIFFWLRQEEQKPKNQQPRTCSTGTEYENWTHLFRAKMSIVQ